MAFLFGRTFVLHAKCPLSFHSDFLHLQLRLHGRQPLSPTLEAQVAPHHFNDYASRLCHRINAALGLKGIAITYDDDSLSILCPIQQKACVERIVRHLEETLPIKISEDADDIIGVGLLMTRAVECALVCAFTNNNWTSIDGNILVNGNIALWEEATPLEAVSVAVQLESNNKITIFLSPDVIQFRRFKVMSVLSENMRREFDGGREVNFRDELLQTVEGIHNFKCVVFPSRQEGYVVGCSKNIPNSMDSDSGKWWKGKYNITLPTNCFYVQVLLTYDASYEIWVPSCLVLTRSGLIPVGLTTRTSKITCVIDNFRRTISDWNFFNCGELTFEAAAPAENVILSESSGWMNAKDVSKSPVYDNIAQRKLKSVLDVFSNLSLNSIKDFRRPKPVAIQSQSIKEEERNLQKRTKSILDSGSVIHNKLVPRFAPYKTIELYGKNSSEEA